MGEVTTYFKQPKPEKRRRQWNSTLPAGTRKRRVDRHPNQAGVTPMMRLAVWGRAGGRCQADGLHHPDCPGVLPPSDWVPHHVWPRGKGGPDDVDNLIAVYCAQGLGWNSCHGQIHNNPRRARELGLLAFSADDLIGPRYLTGT